MKLERTVYVVRFPGDVFLGGKRYDYASGAYSAYTCFHSARLFSREADAKKAANAHKGEGPRVLSIPITLEAPRR